MGVRNEPNFRKATVVPADASKSRTAVWEAANSGPITHQVSFPFVRGVATFELPANCAVVDEVVVVNNSSIAFDAAVGTTSGGTEIANPASVAAGATGLTTITTPLISRTARTIYVTAAAYPTAAQGGAHVVLQVREYPPVADATALS